MRCRIRWRCKVNIFVLLCYKEWAARLIYNKNLSHSSMLQCLDNCVDKFMTACQRIFHSSYKHTFWTPKHMTKYKQTFMLHNKAYDIIHTNIHVAHQSIWHTTYKHSFWDTKIYNQVESSLDFTRHKQALTFVICT